MSPPMVTRPFDLQVDKYQNDRATEIKLCSLTRPHMRAFHAAWVAFLTAFFMWFAISPLLGVWQTELGISREDIWLTTILSDVSTVVARFIVGEACDRYGARLPMAAVLVLAAIPTALLGTVRTFSGLCMARFGIGIAGSSFVMAQYWTGQFFVKEKIGTANAIVAGLGNWGGGLAQLVMGAGLYPLVKNNWTDDNHDVALRTIFIFPALLALVVALFVATQADDAPQGYLKEMKRLGTIDLTAPTRVTFTMTRNAWLLGAAYACSFGVEISLNNAGSLYFADEYGLGVSSAAAAASTVGMTNIFARTLGGVLSDNAMRLFGMQGRLGLCVLTMLWQGCATLCFAYLPNGLGSSIGWLTVTSIGINLTEGAIFGIVPYINPAAAGQMAGIVGLGGNLGGIVFGFFFRHLTYQTTFATMGIAALASLAVYGAVYIPGQATLWTQGTSLEAINEKAHEEATGVGTGNDLEVPPATKKVPTQAPSTRLTTINEA